MGRCRAIVAILTISLSIAGLATPQFAFAADTPVAAVDDVLDAIAEKRFDELGTYVCEEARGAVAAKYDYAAMLRTVLAEADPQLVLDAMTVSLEGRSVTVLSLADDAAEVRLEGVAKVVVDNAGAALVAPSDDPDRATDTQALTSLTDTLAEGLVLDATVHVVRVGDDWLMCGEVESADVSGVAALFDVAGAVAARPATDSNCVNSRMNAQTGHQTYVLQENVGLVGWRVNLSINAWDRCSHGALGVGVTIYNANVSMKGGYVVIGWIAYQRTGSSGWYVLPWRGGYLGVSGSYSWIYSDGGHLDLTNSTRVTGVKAYTYVSFNGVASGSKFFECNLISRTCA